MPMQTANVMVSLAGDAGNQVPKYGVTAAEIAVLNAVHSDGSVTDIEPTGEVNRSHREERARLQSIYGKMQDGRDTSPVSLLFPGAAARVFERLDELDLPPEMFKAKTRVTANDEPAPAPEAVVEVAEEPVDPSKRFTAAQKRAQKAKAKTDAKPKTAAPVEPVEPAQADVAVEDEAEDDGIGEMTDGKGAFG